MKISLGYLSLEAVDVSFRQHLVATLGVSFRAGGTGGQGGVTGKGLGGSHIVGHTIDRITSSYATGPLKSWTFHRSCVGAGGLFPAWHLTCMPQSQNSLGCFLNEDFREKT